MRRVAAFLLAAVAAAAAGIDGQWQAVTNGGPSGTLLVLKSDGERLTGWMTQTTGKIEIANGSFHGTAVSFEMTVTMRGQTVKLSCSGELAGDELRLEMRAAGFPGEDRFTMRRVALGGSPVDRFAEAPAPEEVGTWLKANAIRLASVKADAPFDDMAPLADRLRDARIVGMGEATHGTREFQQLKVRMFRFLVEKLGFTVFGIESNWPESLVVNQYVLGADVDPAPGIGFGWWHTEDMRGLLEWMRKYNQDPAHTRKLHFYGFDMQGPGLAAENVLTYLARVDRRSVDTAGRVFTLLGDWPENKEYEATSAGVKRETAETLAALLRQFDERRADYVRRSSEREWTMARQNMVIVKQAEVKLGQQDERGRIFRDRAMAENAAWILDQEPPGTKMMLWAHNGHVATAAPLDAPDHRPMGAHLRTFFGDQYVSAGFVFQLGSFRAVDMPTGQIQTFTVGPPPRGGLDATLASIGAPLFAFDLRRIAAGPVKDWFASPHVSRQIGGGYSEETPGVWMHRVVASREFDFLIFVDRTTGSR